MTMDVDKWLGDLGLDEYVENFRKNNIKPGVLPRLTSGDLKDIGVGAVGDRLNLLDAIAKLPGVTPTWSLSGTDMGKWLRDLDLDQCEKNFRKYKVNPNVLPRLTADDLKDIGVDAIGDRRKLLDAVTKLPGVTPTWSIPTLNLVIYMICYLDILYIIFGLACVGWLATSAPFAKYRMLLVLTCVCIMSFLAWVVALHARICFPNFKTRTDESGLRFKSPEFRPLKVEDSDNWLNRNWKRVRNWLFQNLISVFYIVCSLNVVVLIVGSAYVGGTGPNALFTKAAPFANLSLSIVLALGACFTFGISWALALYTLLRGDEPLTNEGELHFHNLARQHKQWAQLWFTISTCVLIAGGMLLILMMQRNKSADTNSAFLTNIAQLLSNTNNTDFKNAVITQLLSNKNTAFLTNDFITQLLLEFLGFSFFLVVWNWSVRHFRAHWHNFIELAYRSRALDILRIMADEGGPERSEIRRIAAELLARYGATAYLESEHETTLAEKMVHLKDKAGEAISGTKPA